MALALIVHGGAGIIPADRHAAASEGCQAAVEAGWRALLAGGSALDAVQTAIMTLEDNPGFNAGTGAVLTVDGRAELDAGLMDGEGLHVGAVAGVQRVKNPILLARAVLASPHALLVGTGAEQFATEAGLPLCDPEELVTAAQRERWKRGYREGDAVNVGPANGGLDVGAVAAENVHADDTKHGTVGAVALDAQGRVAAGASTGGIAAKHPGRVGDTPLAGCGFAAERGLGGVSCTGQGEDFIRMTLARRALDLIAGGMTAQEAADEAIRLLGARIGGSGGLIILDQQGRPGFARNTPTMAYSYMIEGAGAPVAGV
ncbi:MAG TPA: isoaspartyl peptidase/L-asparaginase [Ktedonobacterales bacterium]|nr:isoaspartyl peptidase/L-asparaginase [Ktedonobacterales bacterium]